MTARDRIASVIHGSRPYCYEDWETEGCLCHDQADKVLDELDQRLDEAANDLLNHGFSTEDEKAGAVWAVEWVRILIREGVQE